jgi:putative YpdA family bacillithiol system oxidoreductase
MAHTENITKDHLRGLEVFSGLADPALDWLLQTGNIRNLKPQDRLSNGLRHSGEDYCFLLRGVMGITIEPTSASPAVVTVASKRPAKEQRFLGYFQAGACFSNAFLNTAANAATKLDCVAANAATLLEIDRVRLNDLLLRNGRWQAQLASSIAAQRQAFLSQQAPAQQVVQDFFLRENFVTSSIVRVGRLDRCLDCNKCHDACAERHGAARMARFGPTLGQLTFPVVCRTCQDQPCVEACSFGGIAVDEASGDVHISDRCAGCGACAQHCPNDAISMLKRPYTVGDFPDPMPLSDTSGMTNVNNLLVAGDVSGAALIRLAMNEAVRAVDRVPAKSPANSAPQSSAFDVVVVGGGPAGLAAALRCRERNLSYCVLEKDRIGSTIRDYPKHKHVMAEPSNVPLTSSLWFDECTKEELLERWQRTVEQEQIRVHEHTEVQRIEAHDGSFTLHTNRGAVQADHVIVCIGKRGSPRRLGVPGEEAPRVRYALSDPDECANQQVLVVGGGDSAVEAAIAIADVPGATVTLSYRQAAFTRTKAANRKRLEEYASRGKLSVELQSQVVALEPNVVRLKTPSGVMALPNQLVFALLGAEPPTEFLQHAGIQVLKPGTPEMAAFASTRGMRQRAVKCDHCAGYADRACMTACPTGALIEVPTEQLFANASAIAGALPFSEEAFVNGVKGVSPRARRVEALKTWGAVVTILVLIALGIESFMIRTQPERSALGHFVSATGLNFPVSFTSGRGIGHWFGYIGASLMLASILYSLRTRVNRLRTWGSQTGWLSAHLWLGFTGATLVTYHSALKLDRWAGIACYLMWLVIVTGAVGRYVFGWVHSNVGLAQFELSQLEEKCRQYSQRSATPRALGVLFADGELKANRWTLTVVLLEELRDRVALLWVWAFGTKHLQFAKDRSDMLACLAAWAENRRRNHYASNAKAVLKHWNIVHIILAIAMFILAGIHIVYGFLYKAV